ncbi:MAG: hypothetical protein HN509_02800 [Halobacteriovoraceae bacterium]|jgi:hypothetical protein|nr:hypothetical protein [Halobacteriovoraceae bacterium]MBT5095517.1 hypothetical protein [Halobacteriovoraceae bacterium]
MIKPHFQKTWIIIGYLGILAIFSACLLPLQSVATELSHSDKWLHLFCYAAVTFWFTQLKDFHTPKIYLPVLLVMSPLIEILQEQTGYRFFEWYDMLANLLGTILGVFLGYYFPDWLLRFERTFKN